MFTRFLYAAMSAIFFVANPVLAQDVWITPNLPFVEFELYNEFYLIERDQNPDAVIPEKYSKTSRACPPACIQPMTAAEGVVTVGEVEVLAFIQDFVEPGTGFLVDVRDEAAHLGGTIPGAVNMPSNMFIESESNPFLGQLLRLLGGKPTSGGWSFDNAKNLTLFCDGPWCGQSADAIRNLLAIGYPADRILSYRGGMQSWVSLGLSVIIPAN